MAINHLGKTIFTYRKSTHLTIRQLAQASHVSASLISQIENGKSNPTISVLESLAQALNIPLFKLFIDEIMPENLISRKKDRQNIYRKDSAHIVQDVLTPDFLHSPIKLLMMDLKPYSVTTKTFYEHSDQEELAIIMKGAASVELDKHEYQLHEGDVVRIPACLKHRFLNPNKQPVTVLFVLTQE